MSKEKLIQDTIEYFKVYFSPKHNLTLPELEVF